MTDKITTVEGDTLDAIAHRHYGVHNGTTEVLLEANRGLARYPLELPEGLVVILPTLEDQPIKPVRLYD